MIICKNCRSEFSGKYCNNCGQKHYTESDKDIISVFHEIFHFLTHFEGTFFTSIKAIYLKPAKLSLDYCNGIRKKYYKPISLYFFIIVLYLIFPFFEGLNVPLKSQKVNFGNLVINQVEAKISKTKVTEDQFSEKYSHISEKVSKILLFLFIPFSCLLIVLLFLRGKKMLFDLLIYSTEINIFFILTFFLFLPIILAILGKLVSIPISELQLICMVELIFIIYVSIFLRRVYHQKWLVTILKSLVFIIFHLFFYLIIYRFLLFETSFLLI